MGKKQSPSGLFRGNRIWTKKFLIKNTRQVLWWVLYLKMNYFTAFFKTVPALNFGALEAGIFIVFPVAVMVDALKVYAKNSNFC